MSVWPIFAFYKYLGYIFDFFGKIKKCKILLISYLAETGHTESPYVNFGFPKEGQLFAKFIDK